MRRTAFACVFLALGALLGALAARRPAAAPPPTARVAFEPVPADPGPPAPADDALQVTGYVLPAPPPPPAAPGIDLPPLPPPAYNRRAGRGSRGGPP